MSMLDNGSPTKKFKREEGLRQWDPLVLYFFLIVTEGLSETVGQAKYKGLLEGTKVGQNDISVSML